MSKSTVRKCRNRKKSHPRPPKNPKNFRPTFSNAKLPKTSVSIELPSCKTFQQSQLESIQMLSMPASVPARKLSGQWVGGPASGRRSGQPAGRPQPLLASECSRMSRFVLLQMCCRNTKIRFRQGKRGPPRQHRETRILASCLRRACAEKPKHNRKSDF